MVPCPCTSFVHESEKHWIEQKRCLSKSRSPWCVSSLNLKSTSSLHQAEHWPMVCAASAAGFNTGCSCPTDTHARLASWVRPSTVAGYMLRNADLEMVANDINSPPKQTGWQQMLEQMISERSLLIADPAKPGFLVLSQFGRKCNTTFEVSGVTCLLKDVPGTRETHQSCTHGVHAGHENTSSSSSSTASSSSMHHVDHTATADELLFMSHSGCAQVTSGGIMGVGQVNRSSIGAVVLPNLQPFKLPYIIQGTRSGSWRGRMRAVFIALIVMVSVFGALLLGCLGLLIYRLCQAGKRKGPIRGSPFDDGIAHMEAPVQSIGPGVSSLEHQSKRVGPSGGL